MIVACDNHERLTAWRFIPLLVIDVWEHAYYLKHRNRRGEFVQALFAILDRDNARARFEATRKLRARHNMVPITDGAGPGRAAGLREIRL